MDPRGSEIPGASGATYTTGPADAGQTIAARLLPSQAIATAFTQAGTAVLPFTTNAITVAQVPAQATKTKVKVVKRFKATQKVTMKVTVKAPAGTPEGTVSLSIGKFKTEKTLDDGKVLLNLPRLAPGTYRVKVAYSGSAAFVASKAKKVKITVTK